MLFENSILNFNNAATSRASMRMRLLLLPGALGLVMLRAPASRRSSTRQFGRVVAREGVVEQLLSLEAERRELRARLKANEERQRALAMGADVEDATPRTAADADACETAPSAWAEACDVDDVDGGAAAPRRGAAADESLGDFARGAASRGSWLVGLLAAQSLSSLVLERNADVIQRHPVIVRRAAPARSPSLPTRAFQVFFLTMLVGAGGNAGNQAAVRIIRGLAVGAVVPGENRGGHQIFNPTSMCAHATVSTQAFPPCFEKSMRAIDPSKNQPNRLRCDRAREFKVWSGRPKPVVDLHAGENGLSFVAREAKMAVVLAVALAAVGFLRARRRRARRARRDVPDGRARARRSPRSPRAPSPRPARSRSPSSSSSR